MNHLRTELESDHFIVKFFWQWVYFSIPCSQKPLDNVIIILKFYSRLIINWMAASILHEVDKIYLDCLSIGIN